MHPTDDEIKKNNHNVKIIKSLELDVLIAETDSELEYKKRLFAMERGPSEQWSCWDT